MLFYEYLTLCRTFLNLKQLSRELSNFFFNPCLFLNLCVSSSLLLSLHLVDAFRERWFDSMTGLIGPGSHRSQAHLRFILGLLFALVETPREAPLTHLQFYPLLKMKPMIFPFCSLFFIFNFPQSDFQTFNFDTSKEANLSKHLQLICEYLMFNYIIRNVNAKTEGLASHRDAYL